MSLDIVPADKEKWYLRIAMNWFIKKYSGGKNSEVIHDEMEDCGNPLIRYMLELRDAIAEKIKEDHQRKMISRVSEFLLWILYKDTAYRQIFFWSMKKMMEDKEKLLPMIEKYSREPEDWYVNVWHDSKELTKEQRESGEISDNDMSRAEKYFVPRLTKQRIEKELEEQRKEKGW